MLKKTVDNVEIRLYNEVEARGKKETESFEGVQVERRCCVGK